MKLFSTLLALILPLANVTGLELGEPVPDFELAGSDGQQHRLSDYRGQVVVMAWFPKAFTGG